MRNLFFISAITFILLIKNLYSEDLKPIAKKLIIVKTGQILVLPIDDIGGFNGLELLKDGVVLDFSEIANIKQHHFKNLNEALSFYLNTITSIQTFENWYLN